jgi:hypothetical protein
MKPIHKGALGLLVLSAAGLTALSAAALRSAASSQPIENGNLENASLQAPRAPATSASRTGSPADSASPRDGLAARTTAPASGGAVDAPCQFGDQPADVPDDLRVTVKATPKGRVVAVERRGQLVTLHRGRERHTAVNKAEWTEPSGGGALVWETTDPKTLETVRGDLALDAEGTKVTVSGAVSPAVVEEDVSAAHACRGVGDGATGFVVVCRVSGQAAATSVGTKDSKEGVWFQTGDTTLVRFDLPMEGDGADAKVIGLEKQGRGVLLRVEASRVPGEKEALLAIGSGVRDQPHPIRRGCVCRLPIDPLL